MKRSIRFVTLFLLFFVSVGSFAQSYSGVEKFPLKNGLQKVKSGQYYGVYDAKDNVLVSVEYADFAFVEGIAILTKDDGTVHGYIKENGEVYMFEEPYEYHPQFPYYWDDYLPVRKVARNKSGDSPNGRWMFIDDRENPIFDPRFNLKKINVNARKPYTFYQVSTFTDGYAVVTTNQNQVIHIDKKGNRSFVLPKDESCYFRSSVRDGECVMVTGTGIKIYQENQGTKEAVVKENLSSSVTGLDTDNLPDSLSFNEGTLHLDLWGRPTSYVPKNGEIYYFVPPVVNVGVIDPPPPVFDLKDLDVSLERDSATASERGIAKFAVIIKNNSAAESGSLNLTVMSDKVRDNLYIKEENKTFILEPGAEKRVPFDIPARFAEERQRHNITITVSNEQGNIEEYVTVTVRRWTSGEINL